MWCYLQFVNDSASEQGLDEIDRKILALLQETGRMTNAALADAVGLTPTPMLQRIKKLEQSGVIRGYTAIVDPAKVGRPMLAFVHVTLKGHSLANHQKFLAMVSDLPDVLECHHIAGDEDFLLKVSVRDIPELEKFLLQGLSTSSAIDRVKTTFVLSSAKAYGPVPVGAET